MLKIEPPTLKEAERYLDLLLNRPYEDSDDPLFKLYCADTDAGDWHRPYQNYLAGMKTGIEIAKKGVP